MWTRRVHRWARNEKGRGRRRRISMMTCRKLSMKSFISGISGEERPLSLSLNVSPSSNLFTLLCLSFPRRPSIRVTYCRCVVEVLLRFVAIARQRGHPDGVVECRGGGGRNGAWPSALSGTCRHGKIGSGFPADKRSSRGCLDPFFFPWKKLLLFSFVRGVKERRVGRKGWFSGGL